MLGPSKVPKKRKGVWLIDMSSLDSITKIIIIKTMPIIIYPKGIFTLF